MRTKKTEIEIELDRYYYALNSIKMWQYELGHITIDHERKADAISQLIENENRILERINNLILTANLTAQELEYIRLYYFQKRSRVQTERAMFACHSTVTRVRKSALQKLEKVYKN